MKQANAVPDRAATLVVHPTPGVGDATTIADAIAMLAGIGTGGEIFLREGTYALTTTVTMPDVSVVIRGVGASTVISLGANAIAAFTIPTGLTAERTYTFEDFKILGTAVASQRGWSVQDTNSRGVVIINRVDTEEIQFPTEVTNGGFAVPVYVSVTDCHFQQLADNSSVLMADSVVEPSVNLAMVRVRFYRELQDAFVGTFTQGGLFGFTAINIIASDCTFAIGVDCYVGAFNLTDCYLYNFSGGANSRINIADDAAAAVISAVVGCNLSFVDFAINGNGTKFAECYIEGCSFQDNSGSYFGNNAIRDIGTTPSTAVIASGSGGTIIVGCFFSSTAEGTSYVISRPDVVSGCTILGTPPVAAINVTGGGSKITGNHIEAAVPIIETGSIVFMENAISGNFFAGGPPTLLAGSLTLLDNENVRTISTTPVTLDQLHRTVLSDATGGARVVNLPSAASSTQRTYTIKKIDASVNTVTIDASGAETIDGALTHVLTTQYQSVRIQSNGTSWSII